jgi:ATP-binding protein involved in chromosome partitioning
MNIGYIGVLGVILIMNIEQQVIQILNTIRDPLLNRTIEEMPIDCTLECNGNKIVLTLTAGFPLSFLEQQILAALKHAFPKYDINVLLQQNIRPHKTQMAGKGLRGVKNTIAIASGKGGVGKSTVAVNMAVCLARLGARVGILDADIYGPSIPLMLGQTPPLEIKEDRYVPIMAHGIQAMSMGYLTDSEQALIWRGPMLAKALIQMLDSTAWDNLDYLFIDLPPGTGDIQLTLVQKIPLTAAIVVTTPQNVATLDAQKALHMFSKTGIDVLGIVENMATHQCSHCGHEEAIFGSGGAESLCLKHQCKLLGQLPLDSRIRINADEGTPTDLTTQDALTDAFLKTALNSAIELAHRPLNYADKFPNIVVES